MSHTDLADFVRRTRKKKGLSQVALADKLGGAMSNIAISKLENGHVRTVSDTQLSALAQALDVPLEELQTLSQESKSVPRAQRHQDLRSPDDPQPHSRTAGESVSAWEQTLLKLAYEKLDKQESELMLKLLIAMLDQRLSSEQYDELKRILG